MRQTQELAFDLWQLPLSLGAVADSCQKASTALEASYQTIEEVVQHHPTNHVDETGWKREGKLRWLWVATNCGSQPVQSDEQPGRAEPQRA